MQLHALQGHLAKPKPLSVVELCSVECDRLIAVAAWDACLTDRPLDTAHSLFCTDEGDCYIEEETWRTTNFNSVWKRFMDRLLKETRVQEHFAERDIRAKVGSDAETLEKARHILGNATVQITRKHYRRKPDIVR